MSQMRYLLLLARSVSKSSRFFTELGLKPIVVTEKWAELSAGDIKIAIKQTESEAFLTTGYGPQMVFDVPDLQDSLKKAIAAGANMDGAVQYTLSGSKIATLRSPDGHMIGLIES